MGWGRIDDGFDDHAKVIALLEEDEGAAAIGLWTLCFTWAHRNTRKKGKTPGLVPSSLPRRYIGPRGRDLAALLVKVGLWEDRDDGWMFHDFERYLPTEQTRDARAEAGRRGAAARWGNRAGRDGNLPSSDGNGIAADGNGTAPGTENEAASAGISQQPYPDGNEPSGDSKLPSGDSKAMASDGSRAPARRAISNEIAPIPAPDPTEPVSVGEPVSVEGGSRGGGASQAPPKQKQIRGARIPDDFKVTPELVAWARRRCPDVDGRTETEKFVNHWSNKPGKDALKLDWNKAWQNWMLTAQQQAPKSRGTSAPPPDHRREWERNRS